MKFDTSKWGEFKLVDLFNYERGIRLTKNDRTEGKYPLVTAGEYNQGVKEYINNENQKIFRNAITIDMFCNCFVHIEDFCCDDNVLVLTAKQNISKRAMQFISTIINKDKEKWGYIKQYRQNSLEKHSIFLPCNKENKPDFEFMESFIKNIQKEHALKLLKFYEVLKANRGGGIKINAYKDYLLYTCGNETICWKKFDFDKVFVYERGKRYKKTDHTQGQIPYISSTALNNGIDSYVSPPNYMKIYENKLTLANSGSVGSCFYYSYKFVSSDHCMIIWTKDKELNRYIALFLSAIFEKLTKPKYEFAKEINDDRLRAEKISLPTNENGQIAFNFMESFIKNIEKKPL